jgi:hypothetical protein
MRRVSRGRTYFACHHCARTRREEREGARVLREQEAVSLSAALAARLPLYLSPDEREDARQSIALDLLTGKITPGRITPALLREYARDARSLSNDRFKFISLSAPMRDGREFGDTLAA